MKLMNSRPPNTYSSSGEKKLCEVEDVTKQLDEIVVDDVSEGN